MAQTIRCNAVTFLSNVADLWRYRVHASISCRFFLFGSAFHNLLNFFVSNLEWDFMFFLPNKLLVTCKMYTQNKIIENIYIKYRYFKKGS